MSRRGENIYKRKDGRWEGRYVREHVKEKIKYGYVYAKTYKEVKTKLLDASKLYETGKKINTLEETTQSMFSFEAAAQAWIESSKTRLKESSIVKYNNILKTYLVPQLGQYEITMITREKISLYSNELLSTGGRKGTGLSPKTVSSIISVIKSIFEYASLNGNHSISDVKSISVRQSQKPMRILSVLEQQKVSKYLCDNINLSNLGILVCLYTGMRIGEICALKWKDISFEEQYIYVHKTLQRIQRKSETGQKTAILISTPKSNCSIRKIPLPAEIFRRIVTMKCKDNTYFLTGMLHDYIEPRTLQNRFKAVVKSCGIQYANFHALRHTFATRCVELGFDIKSLSEILGHASVNITLNRYVHPSMELKQKNMNMLSSLFPVK